MAKEDIKKLFEDAKQRLDQDHESFTQIIKDDLKTFKKKTLEKI